MILPLLATLFIGPTRLDAPRLTVVISIDQFRTDYLTRFDDLYLPSKIKGGVGGFRWLMDTGTNFVNSKYTHVPTFTGPGHAIIGTGSTPGLSGIIDNSWVSRTTGKSVYCVADESVTAIGGGGKMSPRNLEVSTFGDELKQATGGQSKNVSIAIKDRAAILMIGRLADDCVWMSEGSGEWTTSSFYEKDGRLPSWAAAMNARKVADSFAGKSWEKKLSDVAHKRTRKSPLVGKVEEYGTEFPHKLVAGKNLYKHFARTPMANRYVLESALAAVDFHKMGRDSVPDLLTVNLSTNDYVGHWFGPNSPEVLECSVATDADLSFFFNELEKTVGLKNCLFVLTADHGVCAVPEDLKMLGLPGGRVDEKEFDPWIIAEAKKLGINEKVIVATDDYMVYLDPTKQPESEYPIGDLQDAIAQILRARPEVQSAFTRADIIGGRVGDGMIERMLKRSFHKENSGDVFYFLKPGYQILSLDAATSHGSPWAYDTAVPLLMRGKWVASGHRADQCGPEDIAATVCAAMGIGLPSGNVGRSLAK